MGRRATPGLAFLKICVVLYNVGMSRSNSLYEYHRGLSQAYTHKAQEHNALAKALPHFTDGRARHYKYARDHFELADKHESAADQAWAEHQDTQRY